MSHFTLKESKIIKANLKYLFLICTNNLKFNIFLHTIFIRISLILNQ